MNDKRFLSFVPHFFSEIQIRIGSECAKNDSLLMVKKDPRKDHLVTNLCYELQQKNLTIRNVNPISVSQSIS